MIRVRGSLDMLKAFFSPGGTSSQAERGAAPGPTAPEAGTAFSAFTQGAEAPRVR